ncbi:hypothetical protein PRIPAC_88550 [Pristionchus pacificus]|nr:hypothetical protein PRIPAC_88550 [Pristionchus pacificus]
MSSLGSAFHSVLSIPSLQCVLSSIFFSFLLSSSVDHHLVISILHQRIIYGIIHHVWEGISPLIHHSIVMELISFHHVDFSNRVLVILTVIPPVNHLIGVFSLLITYGLIGVAIVIVNWHRVSLRNTMHSIDHSNGHIVPRRMNSTVTTTINWQIEDNFRYHISSIFKLCLQLQHLTSLSSHDFMTRAFKNVKQCIVKLVFNTFKKYVIA